MCFPLPESRQTKRLPSRAPPSYNATSSPPSRCRFSSCFRSYAPASHVSTAASRSPSRRGGQIPCRSQVFRPEVYLIPSASVVLRRYFSHSVAVSRVGLFLRLAPGAGFFEAMADIRGAKSLLQKRGNLIRRCTLNRRRNRLRHPWKSDIAQMDDGLLRFGVRSSTTPAWRDVKNAPILSIRGSTFVARSVPDLDDFPRRRPSPRDSRISRS